MKRYILLAVGMITAAVMFCGCGKTKNETDKETIMYKQISQEEAKNIMDTQSDIKIVDVRTEDEYKEGHIPGAICIPNETIDYDVLDQLPDQDQTILVYCRSGSRSKMAAEKLADLGYTDIREFGGIMTWEYATEK